jgi:hypothetical protein
MTLARVLPRLFAGIVMSVALTVPAFALETFTDEAKAQLHCPKDVVVWLNLPTTIWHYKGAAVVCEYHSRSFCVREG